jgi:dephospho-CoA kinase
VLYLNHSREYRMVDVDKAVRKALAEGKPKSRGISAATARGTITSLNRRLRRKALY